MAHCMNINADFGKRVVVDTANVDWVPSPMAGVERKMLDRMGAESGHATSVVRYAPHSRFAAHTHSGGEEYLVLEGTFSDEHGDFPKGSYVRNPIGSAHTPYSEQGCIIFVKLCQFAEDDTNQFAVHTVNSEWERVAEGLDRQILHQHCAETVQLLRLRADAAYHISRETSGAELLVLEGRIEESDEAFAAGTWIRNPVGYATTIKPLGEAVVYLKTGHLKQ